jgi:hypothetical protein
MYQASVPVLVRNLEILSDLIARGEAFAREQGIDPQDILDLRLAADMFPLIRQVQTASDIATFGATRLAGIEPPAFPNTETSFAELQARLTKTIDFLETISADKIDGGEDRAITMMAGPHELKFTGQSYLLAFVLPNIFFHITTTYGLLRQKGILLSKADFLGGLDSFQ